MSRKTNRKIAAASALALLGAVGSTLVTGSAFAVDANAGGDGGNGGKAQSACLIPIGLTAGLVGQGGDVSQCNANAGAGGAGGEVVDD